MFKKETADRLLALGFDVTKLKEAASSDAEMDFEVPGLMTKTEISALSTNIRKEGEEKGKTIGKELAIKDLKKIAGLEFEGKDPNKFVDSFKAMYQKNDSEAKQALITLQGKYKTDIGLRDEMIKTKENNLNRFITNGQVESFLPEKTVIAKKDLIDLFNLKYQIEVAEGGTVVKHDGQIIKNGTMDPKPLKDVVSEFALGYIEKNGKNGADSGGGSGTKFTDYNAYLEYTKANNLDWSDPEVMKTHLLTV
jgi:hypothetical protein